MRSAKFDVLSEVGPTSEVLGYSWSKSLDAPGEKDEEERRREYCSDGGREKAMLSCRVSRECVFHSKMDLCVLLGE